MGVFEHEQHRIGVAQAHDLVDQERNRRRLALRRRQRRRRRRRSGNRQQLGQQRQRGRVRRCRAANSGAELFDRARRRIGRGEARGAGQILDHRIKRAVAVIGRALQMDARMRLAGEASLQRLDHARFADPGFADHGDDLALAQTRQAPAVAHQAHFVRAADQRQCCRRRGSRQSGFRPPPRPHPPGRHRTGKSLQFVLAGVFEFEQSAQQILRRLADQDGVGRRQRLQPRGEIGRFADDGALLRGAGADDFADHDEAGGDADPRLHPRAVGQFDAADFRQNADRGAHRAFGRVLEGARKAEIGQHAVAHEFGDETADSVRSRRRRRPDSAGSTPPRSSGSSLPDSAVEPTISQNITVTCRRSASPDAAGISGLGRLR